MVEIPDKEYQELQSRLRELEASVTERKRAAEEASRMVTVVRDSNDAIAIQDVEGRITAWNRGAELMFGYGEQEALQMTIWQLVPPNKAEEQKDFNRRIFAGEKVSSFETQRLTKDGRLLDVWLVVTKLVDDAGKVIGIASTERDITERKRAAEEASRMVTVVRDSNDAIAIQDVEGRITAWNRGAELMFGYGEQEALQMTIWQLVPPNKAEEQKDFNRRIFAGEKVSSFETQRLTKDGRLLDVWLVVTKLVDDAGKVIGIASTERDITERKRAAEEASRMVTVVRDSNDAIAIQDVEGRITAWNRGAELMFGYGEQEALQMTIWQLVPPNKAEEQKDFNRRIFAGEKVSSFETQRLTKDGRLLDVWLVVTKLVDDAGKVIGIASTERDITERKRAAEKDRELAKARELDRLKSMFIASMSHELRTPLNAIIGFTGILLLGMTGELNEEQKKQLAMVKSSAAHLLTLINDVIDVSKIEAEKFQLTIKGFDLVRVVKEVMDSFSVTVDEKALKLSAEVPDKAAIKSDERRVKQIIMNLVGNAIKFTDEGEIKIRVIQSDGKAEVSVKDTGVGIENGDMDKLFKQFSRILVAGQPLQEGTGLGLYLSQKLARVLGGEIKAKSEFGRGSEFAFTLPSESKGNES